MLAPIVLYAAFGLSERAQFAAVFGTASLPFVLLPYVALLALGAVGWRAAHRVERAVGDS